MVARPPPLDLVPGSFTPRGTPAPDPLLEQVTSGEEAFPQCLCVSCRDPRLSGLSSLLYLDSVPLSVHPSIHRANLLLQDSTGWQKRRVLCLP